MIKAPITRAEALQRDAADPLADRAALFDLPEGVTYLVGHSLGPPPKAARDRLAAAHTVRFSYVAGHSGHPENEECDRLAVEAYRELQRNGG
jgi:kynureninase